MTTMLKIQPNGQIDVVVPVNSKIAIGSFGLDGLADILYSTKPNNFPETFYHQAYLTNAQTLLGTFAADKTVRIIAGLDPVYYAVGTAPTLQIMNKALATRYQGTPTAKTVSALLTAAELLAQIITVNQAAAGASALQLPTAANLDLALPDSVAGDAFDVSVINTSTVDAEDASVTTNTGWTLVGSMDFHAYSAAGSLNSSGILRLRKTATGAWTAYRVA